jgi:hypothetical protein
MARYTGAKLKIIQRLGVLPGLTNKKTNNNKFRWKSWNNQKEINAICNTSKRKTETAFQLWSK